MGQAIQFIEQAEINFFRAMQPDVSLLPDWELLHYRNTLLDFWEGLLSGTSGAAPITYFNALQIQN